MKHPVFSLILALLAFSSCFAQSDAPADFQRQLQERPESQLLDVRTPEEFGSGHLRGALLANWGDRKEFERRTNALDREKPVYVYCLSGGRSAAAANFLREKGFTEVIDLKGGINAWKQLGLPVEKQVAVPQISPASYSEMLRSGRLVLVDFGAPWCPPCRRMEPILQELEKEQAERMTLIRIDASNQEELMSSQAVKEMPTFILYEDGKEVWRGSGLLPKADFEEALSSRK